MLSHALRSPVGRTSYVKDTILEKLKIDEGHSLFKELTGAKVPKQTMPQKAYEKSEWVRYCPGTSGARPNRL